MTPANNPRANRAPPPIAENLKQALHLAGRGLRVFPLIENGATPAFSSWQDRATSDPDTLKAWFTGPYKSCNLAVATGRGVFVADADIKNGGRGVASLEQMEMEGLDLGFTVDTRSGGRHAYFTIPDGGSIQCSVKKLQGFPDIDVRADGGYVVAPGSVIDGKKYTIRDPAPLAPMPDWLADLARKAKDGRDKADATPLIELDTEPSIQRAILYLKDDAPAAQEGAGGSDMTYMVAARVKDYGVSEEMCFELMDHHWNEQKAFPAWAPDELETVIGNAYRYGTSSPGSRDARAEFDAVEIDEPANDNRPKRRKMYRLTFDDAAAMVGAIGAPYLIKGIMDQHTFGVVYGPSNSGKTFFALRMGFAIATGTPWDGHKISAGTVLYVATEGGLVGATKRIAALKKHFATAAQPPLDLVPCPVDLHTGDADVKQIVQLANDAAEEHGQELRLIVIDTLSRALAGGDENSSVDMGKFIMNIDRLREAANCAVLVVHHTGKKASNGARGWSGLRAAIDTEIEIDEAKTINFVKQRDMEKLPMKDFKLTVVGVGNDSEGDPISSCVLEILTSAEKDFGDKRPLAGKDAEMLHALAAAIKENGALGGEHVASWDEWQRQFFLMQDPAWLEGNAPPEGCSPQNLRKRRKTVLESCQARVVGDDIYCIDP